MTKAVDAEPETKTEAAGFETEAKTETVYLKTEAEAQGSWPILLSVLSSTQYRCMMFTCNAAAVCSLRA